MHNRLVRAFAKNSNIFNSWAAASQRSDQLLCGLNITPKEANQWSEQKQLGLRVRLAMRQSCFFRVPLGRN